MKRIVLLPIFVLIFGSLPVIAQTLEDVVYLKNGSIVHGIIIEQVPNQSLKIQTHNNDVFVYKFEDIEKITKEKAHGVLSNNLNLNNGAGNVYLNPALSFTFSFFVPGAGQMYNGQFTKGAVLMVSSAVMLTGTAFTLNYLPLFGYGVIWAYAIIDAPLYANKMNKIHNLSYGLSPTVLNLAMNNKPYPGLSFSVKF